MNARRNPASSLFPARARVAQWAGFGLLLCVVLAGCRHKTPQYTIPTAPQIPIEPVDPQSGAPVIAPVPSPDLGPLPPVKPPAPPPRRRSGPKEEPAPPAPVVSEPAPAALAIGSLSTGVDTTPQVQQQARDMISSILKRIAALPSRTAQSQKPEIRQVRHFLDQAQQALSTGDTEGAKNLATKAGLLMNDIEKR